MINLLLMSGRWGEKRKHTCLFPWIKAVIVCKCLIKVIKRRKCAAILPHPCEGWLDVLSCSLWWMRRQCASSFGFAWNSSWWNQTICFAQSFIKGTSVAINKHEAVDGQESVSGSCLTAERNHSSVWQLLYSCLVLWCLPSGSRIGRNISPQLAKLLQKHDEHVADGRPSHWLNSGRLPA